MGFFHHIPHISKTARRILIIFGTRKHRPKRRQRTWRQSPGESFCTNGAAPNIVSNFWNPISPDWGQISARSLHRWVGGVSPYTFGQSQNFCGSTPSGSKVGAKKRGFLRGRFRGCSDPLTPHSEYCRKCPGGQGIHVGDKSKIKRGLSENPPIVICKNSIFGGP